MLMETDCTCESLYCCCAIRDGVWSLNIHTKRVLAAATELVVLATSGASWFCQCVPMDVCIRRYFLVYTQDALSSDLQRGDLTTSGFRETRRRICCCKSPFQDQGAAFVNKVSRELHPDLSRCPWPCLTLTDTPLLLLKIRGSRYPPILWHFPFCQVFRLGDANSEWTK